MTEFVDSSHFDRDACLDQAVLTSLVVESAAGILATLLPLGLISDKTQNIATVLHVNDEGQIIRTKLAMAGRPWSKKLDASRLFSDAPAGSRLVIKNLDVSGLEFPPGQKTSLWMSSSEFEWSLNKTNNREGGSFTSEELVSMDIPQWSIRVHVVANSDPTIASLKWVAIPLPAGELNSLPGDPRRPGYPTVALSDGEGNMTGVPDIEQESSLVGVPFYPCMINEAAPASAITIPEEDAIINAMKEFWREGNTVRNMRLADWQAATEGPGEPAVACSPAPALAYNPNDSLGQSSEEPSEGKKIDSYYITITTGL
jgi:hypothetical protein